jgi:hypothetical protein
MKLKELLLNGFSFNEILRQFSVDKADVTIKDEEVILSKNKFLNTEILKEKVCIEAKNAKGIINFFGTLHCNLADQLAVFEVDSIDKSTEKPLLN